jgi:hypothetical protein
MYEEEFSRIEKEIEESRISIEMTLKMIKVLQKEIVISNEEIDELINYFQEMERYTICSKLQKLKK